jgi:hypothetical protein
MLFIGKGKGLVIDDWSGLFRCLVIVQFVTGPTTLARQLLRIESVGEIVVVGVGWQMK